MIVQATFRGHMHENTFGWLKRKILPEVLYNCWTVYRDKTKSKELRDFASETYWKLKAFSGGSMGDTFENDIMKLIFNATTIANIAINATSGPLTDLEVALHTANPGDSGNQTTSEATYTDYARVAVARTSGGWTVTANSVSPFAAIAFPVGSGGSGTVTYASVGTAHTSTGKILFSGTVTPNIVTGTGVTPSLSTSTAITID